MIQVPKCKRNELFNQLNYYFFRDRRKHEGTLIRIAQRRSRLLTNGVLQATEHETPKLD